MAKNTTERHLLKRITVLDKQCSCPLYDKIISWKTDDHSPGTAAKLISLFNSIALTFNDINKGPDGKLKDANDRIRRVIFEQSIEQHRKSKSNYNKYSTGLPSLGGRTNTSKSSTSASRFMMAQNPQSQNNSEMEIYFLQLHSVYVAIFFKPAYYLEDGYEPQLLRDIAHEFLSEFETKLKEFETQFFKLAKDQEMARNDYSFMPFFEHFQPTVDESSGFTIHDVMSPTQQTKKYEMGTHMLPLSSDLINPTYSNPNSLPLENDLIVGQIVQPKFFPPLQTPTNNNQQQQIQLTTFNQLQPQQQQQLQQQQGQTDERTLQVQKEQRSQRIALQEALPPPPTTSSHSTNNQPSKVTTPTPTNQQSQPQQQQQQQHQQQPQQQSQHNDNTNNTHESLKGGHQLNDDDLDGFDDDD